jgi:leucyl-tRNA synthetase
MIQDENTTPGYCFLQLLQHDIPLPVTVVPNKYYITDRKGRILLTNKVYDTDNTRCITKHGPSIATQGLEGLNDSDKVLAYPCKSWLKSAESGWLERQGIGRWPTQEMKKKQSVLGVVLFQLEVSSVNTLNWSGEYLHPSQKDV